MSEQYRFLPWSRQGLASKITQVDTLDATAPARARFPVRVRVNAGTPVGVDVALFGPGDIIGVDPRGIVRTEPRRYATDVEPNYMAAIEFDRPDFPWMFTPAAAGGNDRLRPWCVLAVVEREEGMAVQADRSRPLPFVTVPVAELPPLSDSWAWAHTQVITAGSTSAAIADSIRTQPDLNVSRILCPRRLEPDRNYLALLVPAFAAGVDAGLARPSVAADLAPAWKGDEDEVELPVYHHWEFATGPGGDFESLARKLAPPAEPLTVGIATLDLSAADPGLPPLPDGAALFEGALVGPFHVSEDIFDRLPASWLEALTAILDSPQRALDSGTEGVVPVAPPVYGAWPAATHTVDGDPPRWLRQLNLDPRLRAVAGLAAQVVRANQEDLMHDAWEQVGDLLAANRLLDRARFSREGARRLHERMIQPMSADAVFRLAAPLLARVTLDDVTVRARLHRSAVPDATADPAFRRLTSPRSRLMRRASTAGVEATPLVAGLDGGKLAGDPAAVVPDALERTAALPLLDLEREGTVDTEPIGGKRPVDLGLLRTTRTVLNQRRTVPRATEIVLRPDISTGGGIVVEQTGDAQLSPGRTGEVRPTLSGETTVGRDIADRDLPDLTVRDALRDGVLSDRLAVLGPVFDNRDVVVRGFTAAFTAHVATLADPPPPPAAPPLGLADVRAQLLARTAPDVVVRARVATMIRGDGGEAEPPPPGDDDLARLTGTPRLDRPLYEPLAAYAPELFMPGIGAVPTNTVALVRTNPRFVEAFLVGANTEFAGELLWREYPARRDGTPMRRFWDRAGGAPDIPEIAAFDPGAAIGGSATEGAEGDLVLVVRGDLLRRYPNAVIYAVKSNSDGRLRESAADRRDPVFRGRLDPDVTFLGFDLTVAEALEGMGWFFVIQQQPTEPRFGFDVPDEAGRPPATWRDATWDHVAVAPGAHLSSTAQVTPPANGGGATFIANAAHLAAIALQQPARVAIHARDLLGTVG